MPAWRQGMAVGEWREIPNSRLSAAPMSVAAPGNTGPQSKVIAWCGFALDTRDSTVYSAANGGHWDYAGNEVNSIRLSDAAPAWRERRAATAVSMIRESTTHYADGAPTSRHSYYGILVNEARGRVMVLGGSRYGNGFGVSTVDGFNIQANAWDAARTFPDVPSQAGNLLATAYVKQDASGDVYAFGNYGIYRWASSANAWSTVTTNSAIYGFEAAAALDSRRNRVLVLGGNGDDRGVFTLGTTGSQRVTLSGPAAGSVGGGGNGMVYDPWMDAYLLRKPGAGSTVYRINASTLAVDTLATTGGASIPNSINGVYRRFLFAPQLGGVVYAPSYEGNLWFLRTT
jgi:hypothetical protein